MSELWDWIRDHQMALETLGGLSLALLLLSLVVFPLVVVNLPADYFVRERRSPARQTRRHPLVWGGVAVAQNILGAILIVAGFAMLVLPGQGILTILMGLALTNFPGKFALERRLFRRPAVNRPLNRIRRFAGRPELEVPTGDSGS